MVVKEGKGNVSLSWRSGEVGRDRIWSGVDFSPLNVDLSRVSNGVMIGRRKQGAFRV